MDRAWPYKEPKVSDSQENVKLAEKGEYQTKTLEVPSSIITGSNILLLDFLIFT